MNYFRSSEFQKFSSSFAGPRAFSPIGGFVILSLLSFGSIFTDSAEAPSRIYVLLFDIVQALLASYVYFLVLGKLINKFLTNISTRRILALLFLFFTTETFRTLYVAILAVQQNLLYEVQWDYRIIAGGLTGILFFGAVAIIANDRADYKNEISKLAKMQNQLLQTTAVTEQDLINNKNRIIDAIRSAVNQALQAVITEKSTDKKNVKVVVDELVRVSDEIVRPMSHELFANKYEYPDVNLPTAKNKIQTNRIFQLVTYIEPFHPVTLVTIGAIQLFGIAVFAGDNPLSGFYAATQFLLFMFLIMVFAKKFIKPILFRMPVLIRIILISLIYSTLGIFLMQRSDISYGLNIPRPDEIIFYLFAVVLIACWSLAFYSALQFARQETLDESELVNEKLSWSAARLGAKLWSEQKKLASIVHKDIQGALIAVALKFKKDVENGKNPEEAILRIRELVSGTSDLVNSNSETADLKDEIEKLNELWEGIFRISLKVDDETYLRIKNDVVCEESVNNFIGEFATNSVKHGKATEATVDIWLAERNKLYLTFENNGEPLKLGRTAGLGTKMAQQQSLSVEYSNLPDRGVSFKAILPIN